MKNLTWQNPEQLFVAQELINKVKSKCCGIKDNVKDGVDLSITITPDDTESRYFSKIVSKSELAGTGMSNAEYMQASVDQYIVLVKS